MLTRSISARPGLDVRARINGGRGATWAWSRLRPMLTLVPGPDQASTKGGRVISADKE